ncbi:MAG TPA: sugar ABC transporter ATP-binding protein [Bacillota bacterium]|nr:sugar ABC transporter ATP-binding protein [Bacillota bacterium]
MRQICKRFGGTLALDNVDFAVSKGEVHALIGENGAGKSTLIKILSGIYSADSGTIAVDGETVEIHSPQDAQRLGIATVHQELNLAPDLTVAENVYLGRLPTKRGSIIDWSALKNEAELAFEQLGVADQIDPMAPVRSLSISKQQLVEIAKAFSAGARLIIMDEPTSSLPESEVQHLFDVVRTLNRKGVSFIYISHRLEEVLAITDSMTVLRDGRLVGSCKTAETSYDDIVRMMVGRELTERFPKREPSIGETVLEVEGLADAGRFRDISFQVRAGEILGISGLMGSGRTELAQAIFGVVPPEEGSIRLNGKELNVRCAEDGIEVGIYLVPEDRKRHGLVQTMSVRSNTVLSILSRLSGAFGVVDKNKEEQVVTKAVRDFNVKTASIDQNVSSLSGGNQQKVVFAKAVCSGPKVLILDEPTRGVDVGAKAEIYKLVQDFASSGGAVVFISSEMPEILGMCDRILVMSEGRIVGEFAGSEATQEEILKCALAK